MMILYRPEWQTHWIEVALPKDTKIEEIQGLLEDMDPNPIDEWVFGTRPSTAQVDDVVVHNDALPEGFDMSKYVSGVDPVLSPPMDFRWQERDEQVNTVGIRKVKVLQQGRSVFGEITWEDVPTVIKEG